MEVGVPQVKIRVVGRSSLSLPVSIAQIGSCRREMEPSCTCLWGIQPAGGPTPELPRNGAREVAKFKSGPVRVEA